MTRVHKTERVMGRCNLLFRMYYNSSNKTIFGIWLVLAEYRRTGLSCLHNSMSYQPFSVCYRNQHVTTYRRGCWFSSSRFILGLLHDMETTLPRKASVPILFIFIHRIIRKQNCCLSFLFVTVWRRNIYCRILKIKY